ncbi:unnamed protein product [Acanthoscelides obtectus]|uniref:Uncharacterized protein n=1 Tax=Acanthoscelides obtectus TaxID=200917 RepID=A0A9P0KEG3_ACAOB|nr:unnamed protein product [Acanthoscelides obtectus]CAK1635723.1 hypothetical protein AOBTE_LOCUS9464 [Acanthoscelides obtectus]
MKRPIRRLGNEKLIIDSFMLFPSTEIFSKRRKIYSL